MLYFLLVLISAAVWHIIVNTAQVRVQPVLEPTWWKSGQAKAPNGNFGGYLLISKNLAIANISRVIYVEGINSNTVTLKSRLTIAQGHWKQNRWLDHTRLTIIVTVALSCTVCELFDVE